RILRKDDINRREGEQRRANQTYARIKKAFAQHIHRGYRQNSRKRGRRAQHGLVPPQADRNFAQDKPEWWMRAKHAHARQQVGPRVFSKKQRENFPVPQTLRAELIKTEQRGDERDEDKQNPNARAR